MLPAVTNRAGRYGTALLAWGNTRPTAAPDNRRTRRHSRRVWVVSSMATVVLVLLVSLVASNVQRHQLAFDEFDEAAHYDYAVALSQGHIPPSGTYLTQATLRMISCFSQQDCGVQERNPHAVSADGYSYEAVEQPPLGYLPYILTVRPDDAPAAALVDARWGGFIWECIGGALLVAVGWLAELSLFELGTVLVICLLSPVQIHAISKVTNDSSALAAGAIVVGTYLVARRRNKAMIIPGLLIGLLVGFMKGLFVVAPFVILLALLFGDLAARRMPTRSDVWRRYGCAACMTVGAVIAYAVWLLIVDARATVAPSVVLHALESFLTSPYPRPFTMLSGFEYQLSALAAYTPAPLYWLWNLAVFGSLAGILLLRRSAEDPRIRAAALAIFTGLAVLAVAFVMLNYVQGHYDFPAPPRYALPILPILGIVVARSLRLRGLLLVGLVLPALAIVAQLVGGQF